jgi:cytosine/uracil/thiamine/allantoin permease
MQLQQVQIASCWNEARNKYGGSSARAAGGAVLGMISRERISPRNAIEDEQWLLSREWLSRAAFLLILAFALLVIGAAFRPLLPIAMIAGAVAFYAIGRFAWHVQRSANARRRYRTHRHTHGVLRILSDWPVPIGLGLTALVIGFALVIAALKR